MKSESVRKLDNRHKWHLDSDEKNEQGDVQTKQYHCLSCGKKVFIQVFGLALLSRIVREKFLPQLQDTLCNNGKLFEKLLQRRAV